MIRPPGIALLLVLLAGCGATPPPPQEAPARPARASAPARIAVDPAALAPPATPASPPRPDPGPEAVAPAPAAPSAPFALGLQPDADWLVFPHPRPAPERYASWRQQWRLDVGQSHVDTALLDPDDKHLLVRSDNESTIRVYRLADRRLIGNFAVAGFASGTFERGAVVWWPVPGPDREPLFLVGNGAGLALHSALSGALVRTLDPRPFWDLGWSPDGRTLLATRADLTAQTSRLTVFTRDGDDRLVELADRPLPERLDGWALSRDNRLLAVSWYPSDTVELFDTQDGRSRWRLPAPRYTGSLAFSPDGALLAVGGEHLLLLDVADPSRRATATRFGNNLHEVRFSPSGDAVAATSYDGHARLFGADLGRGTLRLLKDLRHAGTANVYAASFLRDGSGLVTSSGDRTVRLWGR